MKIEFAFVALMLLTQGCKRDNDSTKPNIGDLSESVYASLLVQPKNMYRVYTAKPGVLEQIFVNEGDNVKAGDILAQIRSENSELNLSNAKLKVDNARENYQGNASLLSDIEGELLALKEQLALDSLNFYRQQKLWDQNIGSKTDLENKKLKYDLTLTKLKTLTKREQQTKREFENTYNQLQNSLRIAESNLGEFYIKSRIAGTVYEILKSEGEYLNLQTPLASIGSTDTFLVELEVDEVDIAQIVLGQLVVISLDAYVDQIFEAQITKIYPQKDERSQTFALEAEFTSGPDQLYSGLSGESNIVISQKKNVLSIPREYLISNNQVKTEDGIKDITIGITTLDRVEVLNGIDSSTVIIKNN